MAILDHMLETLPYHLRNGENINKYYKVVAEMFEEIINAFVEIMESRDLDKSFGSGLDILGDILGETRDGLDDEAFRFLLRTKIASNRSAGDMETLNNFGRLILKDNFAGIVEKDSASLVLKYLFPLTNNPLQLMKKLTAAGVKIDTEYNLYGFFMGLTEVKSYYDLKNLTYTQMYAYSSINAMVGKNGAWKHSDMAKYTHYQLRNNKF